MHSKGLETLRKAIPNVSPLIENIRLKNLNYLERDVNKIIPLFEKHKSKTLKKLVNTPSFFIDEFKFNSIKNTLSEKDSKLLFENIKQLNDVNKSKELYYSIEYITNELIKEVNDSLKSNYFFEKIKKALANIHMLSPELINNNNFEIEYEEAPSESFFYNNKFKIRAENMSHLIHEFCETLVGAPSMSANINSKLPTINVMSDAELSKFVDYPDLNPSKKIQKKWPKYFEENINKYILENHLAAYMFHGYAKEMENKILNIVLQEAKIDFKNKKINKKIFEKIEETIKLLKFNNALHISYSNDLPTLLGMHYYQSLRKAVSRLLPIGTPGKRDVNAFKTYFRYLDLPADEQMEIMAKIIDKDTFKEGLKDLKQKIIDNKPLKKYPRPREYLSRWRL